MHSYKDRFKLEYWQLCRNISTLRKIIYDFNLGILDFELDTDIELLKSQLEAMIEYRDILEKRAYREKIFLGGTEDEIIKQNL